MTKNGLLEVADGKEIKGLEIASRLTSNYIIGG